MDTAYSTEDLAFRDEVRGFFDEAYTPELQARLRSPDYKNAIEDWQRKLYDKGWVAPNWPAEFGGTDFLQALCALLACPRALPPPSHTYS